MWFLIPILAGVVAAGVFWNEIRDWYTTHVEAWLTELGLVGEALKKGFVEIDKVMVRGRRVVKRAVAYFQKAQRYYKKTTEEEVDMDDLPDDVRDAIRKDEKIVMELQQS
jgi:hypothetical protein